ncbi:MAG: hypothetical protein V3T80_09475 [Kiloniellales bacterium]|jgi:hypothetical protein
MTILRRLFFQAVTKVAADPRIRAKAAQVVEREVKPRVQAAWRETKPKLESARDELRDIAAEADPRRDPKGFARRLRDRLRDL